MYTLYVGRYHINKFLWLTWYILSGICFKWILQVLHWSLHTTFAYLLMMAVMTYNVYITVALVIGGSLGYWLFSPTLVQLRMQQFHRKQAIMECDKNCEGNATKLALQEKNNLQNLNITIVHSCLGKSRKTAIYCLYYCRTISYWNRYRNSRTRRRKFNMKQKVWYYISKIVVIITMYNIFLYWFFKLWNRNLQRKTN